MLAATIAFLAEPHTRYLATGQAYGPTTRPAFSQVYAFTCSDGLSLAVHLSSPEKFWVAFARAVGRADLLDDPRLATFQERVRHHQAIAEELAPLFRGRPRGEWLRLLEAADVPCTPIYTLDEVFEDPQVRHLGMEQLAHHPTQGEVRLLGLPVRLSETPLPAPAAPPTLGEHTEALLAELGYSPREIRALREAGAV